MTKNPELKSWTAAPKQSRSREHLDYVCPTFTHPFYEVDSRVWPSVLPGCPQSNLCQCDMQDIFGGKKVRNTLSNREKELQRHGLEKEKPERFCPSLHCLFIYSISVAHRNCSQMMVWHWFDCSQILFRGLSLLGISRSKEIQTLILSLYMRIRRI